VFGISGLLQLTELYDVGQAVGDVNWPKSGTEWMLAQGTDSDLRDIISKVDPDKEVDMSTKGVVKLITEGGRQWCEGVVQKAHRIWPSDMAAVGTRTTLQTSSFNFQTMLLPLEFFGTHPSFFGTQPRIHICATTTYPFRQPTKQANSY
jgi:hypothetical protein